MTRQASTHTLLGAVALGPQDAGRLMALSVAQSALMEDEDESVVDLGLEDAASQGRSSPLDTKPFHSPGLGHSIWSTQSDVHHTGTWSATGPPVPVPVPGGRGGHKKAASVGVSCDTYSVAQHAWSKPLDVVVNNAMPRGSTTSLPTSPTEASTDLGSFDNIPSAHLLSRSVSPPRRGTLCARATPFQSRQKPSQAPQPAPAPTPRQIQLRQQARPQMPVQHRATAPPVRSPPRRPSHGRSRSDLVTTSMAPRPILPVVHEVTAPLDFQQDAVIPPQRCVTPQPFRKPASTADATMPEGWFSAWVPGPGKRLPSLAEIAERMRQQGKLAPTSPPKSSNRWSTPLSSPDTIKASTSPSNKRYSIESTSSTASSVFAGDSQYASSASSTTSVDEPALPVTPYKSRLPSFLQHRRGDSASTMSSGSQSPVYMISFREAARAALTCQSPEKLPATTPTCPAVRITPPIDTASMPEPRFTITPPSAGGAKSPLAQGLELKGVPQIRCTPASASGSTWISLNDEEDEVKAATAPTSGSMQASQREERSRVMLSKLKRRSLEFKA